MMGPTEMMAGGTGNANVSSFADRCGRFSDKLTAPADGGD
jgi:hypothetical protein